MLTKGLLKRFNYEIKTRKTLDKKIHVNYMSTMVWALNFQAKKILNCPIPSVLGQGIDRETPCWIDKNDKERFDSKVARLFINKWENFSRYINFYTKFKKRFIRISQKISSAKLEFYDNNKLFLLYQKFEKTNLEFMLIGQWTGFRLTEMIPRILKQKLEEQSSSITDINKVISTVLTPFKSSALFKEEKEVAETAYRFKSGKLSENKLSQKIDQLVKKYCWIPSMTINAPLWDYHFFEDRITKFKSLNNLKQTIKNYKQVEHDRKKKRKDFKELLKKYPKFADLFKIANWLIILKDERDEIRRRAYFLSRPLFYEIARRMKVDISQLLAFPPYEIIDFLKNKTLPSAQEISQRQKNFIVFVQNKRLKIYFGRKAITFSKKFLRETDDKEQKIAGIRVSAGKAKGVVKIIRDKKDLIKIKKQNILVAITTHPDYLPSMKISKAIVTDEGGFTSHAAIISRELNIPCIVGTKIATKVLKDGDLVEVNANHGVVTILKHR